MLDEWIKRQQWDLRVHWAGSSELSPQSLRPSQKTLRLTQRPVLAQRNCVIGQPWLLDESSAASIPWWNRRINKATTRVRWPNNQRPSFSIVWGWTPVAAVHVIVELAKKVKMLTADCPFDCESIFPIGYLKEFFSLGINTLFLWW
jgi:hypothetical protein